MAAHRWDIPPLSLAAHQLMANAILHGAAPCGAALDVTASRARIAVHDEGLAFPWPAPPHSVPPPESHGLALIRRAGGHLSFTLKQPRGKAVTATFPF